VAVRTDSAQPTSIFNAVGSRFRPVTTTIEVRAVEEELQTTSPSPIRAGGVDVLNSAGTFGDISRYLQLLPGVIGTSDMSNQMPVRGGHPLENLFLIDGFEVPNINHLKYFNK
jgi:hypothetical protein